MTHRLETERLILRKPAARDWPVAEAFYASDRSRYVGGPHDTGAAWRAFAMFTGHWDLRGYGLFALVPRGGPDLAIGIAGPFYPADWPNPEIGWQLWDASVEGTGLAHEAASATRAFARDTLGWRTIV
ncbi:MAG: GNAT family N-acetyltransferase, partial [Shimia sp.]